MHDYIKEIHEIANEITEIGHKLDNPIVIAFILNGLPETY